MSNAYFVCHTCWTTWLGNTDKCPECGSFDFYLDSEIIKAEDYNEIVEKDDDGDDDDQGSTLQ